MKGLSQELEARHNANRVAYGEAYRAYAKAMKQLALDRIEKYSLLVEQNKGEQIEGFFNSGLKQAEELKKEADFMLSRR